MHTRLFHIPVFLVLDLLGQDCPLNPHADTEMNFELAIGSLQALYNRLTRVASAQQVMAEEGVLTILYIACFIGHLYRTTDDDDVLVLTLMVINVFCKPLQTLQMVPWGQAF